jgi:hypothetical protein
MEGTITIQLTQGQSTVIDAVDADLAELKWYAHKQRDDYYAARGMGRKIRKHISMHRVILERKLGRSLEKGEVCDHANGNSLDNRRTNLRIADHSTNGMNRKPNKNTAKHKGITLKASGLWHAGITVKDKYINLGNYTTPEAAATAYNHAAKEYFGEFARYNDIPGWEQITPSPIQDHERLTKANSSGFRGVSWHKGTQKWRASIKVEGKNIHLGVFDNPQDAYECYRVAVRKYFEA